MSASLEDLPPHPDPVLLSLHFASALSLTFVAWMIFVVLASSRVKTVGGRRRWTRTIRAIAGPLMAVDLWSGLILHANGHQAWGWRRGSWSVFEDVLASELALLCIAWAVLSLTHPRAATAPAAPEPTGALR